MPRRRRYSRSRHPRARVTKSVKRYVARKINKSQETKTRLLSYDQQAITDGARTPVSTGITAVAQGITENLRVGNRITLTGLHAQLAFAAGDATNVIRFILYTPKDPNDTLTSVEVSSLVDFDKFRIIMDKYITVGTSGGPGIVVRRFGFKFARGRRTGRHFQFHGANNNDYGNSPIRMYVVSDSGAVADPTMTGTIRAYFKDA